MLFPTKILITSETHDTLNQHLLIESPSNDPAKEKKGPPSDDSEQNALQNVGDFLVQDFV